MQLAGGERSTTQSCNSNQATQYVLTVTDHCCGKHILLGAVGISCATLLRRALDRDEWIMDDGMRV